MSIAHYDMRFLKPLDEALLEEIAKKFDRIITIEDGVRKGGFGSAILEWMSDHGYRPQITRMGIPDEFVEHGTVAQLREIIGLDNESIRKTIENQNENHYCRRIRHRYPSGPIALQKQGGYHAH